MAAVIVLAALACLVLGAPLFAALAVATLACVHFLGDGFLTEVVADMFNAVNKDVLLAIPFFVVAGQLMTEGSIARRIIAVARAWLGWMPAGLSAAAVAACVFFAAISGSSPVTLIAIGSVLFPALVKDGYDEKYSLGLLASAGSLGILIPPSIPMILYAVAVSTPEMPVGVGDLFLAGVMPGLLIAGALAAYGMATQGRKTPRIPFRMEEALAALRQGVWSLLLPVIILGGIYSGFCTATEAAAISVVYALSVELAVHRELELRKVPGVFVEGALGMGTLFLVIVLAMALNQFLALEQAPQKLAEGMKGAVASALAFAILVNVFLLAVGCVMDILSAILILAPILAPMAAAYGFHPVHFGILFIVNLEIGYLTPPIGLNLFVASSVFKKPLERVIVACVPFILIMLVCLGLITGIPAISLGLTGLLD
jgi:C4-dicarboxylate transporter DctM subunit